MNRKYQAAMETKIVLTLLMGILLLKAASTYGDITCTAATTRIQTRVTCHFGVDIGKSKHSFNVEFHYPNLSNNPETPLRCTVDQSDNLICKTLPNVTFDRKVSDQVTLTLPASVDKVGGKFVCQVVPSLPDPTIQPCELTFEDISSTTNPNNPEREKSNTTDSPGAATSDASDETALYVKAIFFFILIVVVLDIVLCGVAVLKRDRIRAWCQEPSKSLLEEGRQSVEAPGIEEKTNTESPLMMPTPNPDKSEESFAMLIPASEKATLQAAAAADQSDAQAPSTSEVVKESKFRQFLRNFLGGYVAEGKKPTEKETTDASGAGADPEPNQSLLQQSGSQEAAAKGESTGKNRKGGRKKTDKKALGKDKTEN